MSTERPKVCFERPLPRDLIRPQPTEFRFDRVRAIAVITKMWMNGETLRVRFMGGSSAQHQIARKEAKWWSDHANLKFDFGNDGDAEIRISFDEFDGAWSYLGTDCRAIPFNGPTMNLGFLDGGTAAHEFGHAIGLAHEHQNPEGGIQWNEEVVIREAARSPNFWDEETTRHNILRKYSIDQINGTEFDPDSIMLYFFPPEWTENGIGTKANDALSNIDRQFISGAKAYPKTGPTATVATELKINARRRTQASIGRFGEEDLFTFVVDQEGSHVVDTRGPTDVVMKVFGPNSTTQLIAEDDDAGYSYNARIVASLIKGRYYVQVRHYNRESGMGDYTVRVRRS